MSVNYDRVCRLCLSSRGELQPIFPTTSSDEAEPSVLASKIKDCVSVQITENDELPTCVCRKCMDNVNNWHIFKKVCERTQNKLQSLAKKDGNQLEEVKIKSEPLSDEAYDDGVVIDGSYPDAEQNASSSAKVQPEGPPILASLGLTPRSDKGVESEKEEDEEYEEEVTEAPQLPKVPNMPEVSITVMRPTGETLHSRQGIQQLASKNCLVCDRAYRYSHNARRHELTSHGFDRYTNKTTQVKRNSQSHMQPKLRPNPFNPKARLMPNPISHKMQLLPKSMPGKMVPHKVFPKPVPVKTMPQRNAQNNLPYPLRIKALKDLQIKKKEPQILKTLLTTKPEVLVSEPEILNSGPESPETLISEPEIASFQVEAILTEPDAYDHQPGEDEMDGEAQVNNQGAYDTVDMESDHEIEIARQQENEMENEQNDDQYGDERSDNGQNAEENHTEENHHDNNEDGEEENEEGEMDQSGEMRHDEEGKDGEDGNENDDYQDANHEENDEDMDDEEEMAFAPVVEINEDMQNNSLDNSEMNDGNEDDDNIDDELDESGDVNDTVDGVEAKELDPDKLYVTKTQREFILKYRDVIQQINTKRCLCCDREYPRRKAVIQHLQKNGQKVPKHTCYNCVVTFSHIGALLSHMRADCCTNLWRVIYEENGITDDMVIENEPKEDKVQYKDIFNARSYACKLCPAKFQLKQFIMKHVLDVHEGGQSRVAMQCVHCSSRFKDRALWKKHIRNGECTVYISCDLCAEKFGNMQDFNTHALAAHAGSFDPDSQTKCVDGRPTDCPICEKKNASYPNLIKHLKVFHNEDRPHYCQNCDEKFEKTEDLNKHIYLQHSDEAMGLVKREVDLSLVKEEAEEYHYSCTECEAIFETVDAWTDHQVAAHGQVAHHCDQCERKFLRPSELAEHKHTHLRPRLPPAPAPRPAAADLEFYCELCVRSFKSRQAYSNHMRIHAKVPTTNRRTDQPAPPPPRAQHFPVVQPAALQFKTDLVVPNAPYSCDICGKGFMHKKNIWKHKKVLHAELVGGSRPGSADPAPASTEEDDAAADEHSLSTPQFDSFNFADYNNASPKTDKKPKTPPQPGSYSCDLCYKKFPLRTSLWKHKRAKHGIINASHLGTGGDRPAPAPAPAPEAGGRSSCTICKISFADKKSYYRHRKNVHKSTSQVCKLCGIPLGSTLELYDHLRSAHARELLGFNASGARGLPGAAGAGAGGAGAGLDVECEEGEEGAEYQARYPCELCGKQFVGLLALQNHQCAGQAAGAQPSTFDCEICHKSYTSIAALKSHRGWHLRSPDGKAAANNSGLWMPQHKVTNKVSKHEVTAPAAAAKRRLPPEVEVTVVNPNKKMRSDDSLEMDQSSASGGPDDRYCTICDKEFTKRAAYQRHMDEVHQPNSVFCPVCDRSFTRKSTLLVHMRKHYGEEGGAGAGEGGGEESAESEEEPAAPPGEFTCGQCGDGVASPRDLIAHRAMHATPSQHFCGVCKVYFSRGPELATHTRARHGGGDGEKVFFPCAMCDRFYMNKKSLQRHIEMAH
ncbi:hypothetical protein JYU34_007285 [Plutella xylostella]|uniref:Uncharacterized protein n=1 Tax=Plutella xylostella TaxID=51655 RepID=A0ABQ7QQ16_PLUXY|nr:hypothetical protein JYU34_007285 [Plutella xylostella]